MTTPNIPEAAIEAGAQAARGEWSGPNSGSWDAQQESVRNAYRDLVHAALTAALPHLHPVVETVEQLDALPVGSIVQMNGCKAPFLKTVRGWESTRYPGKPVYDYTGNPECYPATVLHMGGDDA